MRPRRRWKRWAFGVLALLLLALLATWAILTSSWFLTPRIKSAIEALANVEVTLDSAAIDWPDAIVLTDARFSVKGIGGDAGEVLVIPEARIQVDPQALRNWEIVPTSLTLTGPRVRISENLADGKLNVVKFRLNAQAPFPTSSGTSVAAAMPPRVVVEGGLIEVGVHDASGYRRTGSLPVTGSLLPESTNGASTEHWYTLNLQESAPSVPGAPPAGAADPLRLSGRLDASTGALSVRLTGLKFDDEHASVLPRSVRKWWETIQPSGLLGPVSLRVDPDGQYRVEIPMDGVDWSLPIQSPDGPPLFDMTPRVTAGRGTIVVSPRGVDLIALSGVIDDVRYRLRGAFSGFAADSAFDLTLEFNDFDIARSRRIFSVFPKPVRDLVDAQRESMGQPAGSVSARIHLTRAEPDSGVAAPLDFDGRVELSDFSLVYAGFPYPLRGLDGALEFDRDEVRVISLAGLGPSGAKILLSGRIFPLGPDPGYEFDLYAVDVPVDDYLRTALPERNRGAIDTFFHFPSAQSLRRSGIINSRADYDALRARLTDLVLQRRELEARTGPAAQRELERLRAEAANLEMQLARPMWDLGGLIDLKVHMTRPQGPNQHSDETIDVSLPRAARPVGLLFDEFPYPAFVADGAIRITPTRIDITRDLVVVGPTGGRALVSGSVDRVRTETGKRLEPHVRFTATQIPVDDLLLASIPGDRTEDPADARAGTPWRLARAAQVLGSLGLEGFLLADGEVYSENQHTEFNVLFKTDNARIGGPVTTATARDASWLWPEDYPLTDVSAEVLLTRRDLTISRLTGRHENARLSATASLSWMAGLSDIDVQVTGENIPIEDPVPEIFAGLADDPASLARLAAFRTLNLSGAGDFSLCDRRVSGLALQRSASLFPSALTFIHAGRRVNLENVSGSLSLRDSAAHLSSLTGDVRIDDSASGRLSLTGRWTPSASDQDKSTFDVVGSLEQTPWESELLPFALELAGQGARRNALARFGPRGFFDASFAVARLDPAAAAPRISLRLLPTALTASVHGRDFSFLRESGSLVFDSGDQRISFEALTGRSATGRLALGGSCTLASGISLNLLVNLRDHTIGDLVRAVLPEGFVSFVESGMVAVNGNLEVDALRVTYAKGPAPADPANLSVEGRVWFSGGGMNLPLSVTEADGFADVSFTQRIGPDPTLTGFARLNLESLKVADRAIGPTLVHINTEDNGRAIAFPLIRGELAGGVVTGSGRVALTPRGRYALELLMSHVGIEPLLPLAMRTGDAAAPPRRPARRRAAAPDSAGPGWGSASLSISGLTGVPESRTGRGDLRIDDATIYNVPAVLWILQMSAMSLPTDDAFNTAEASFYIDGNDVVFENLRFASPAITLLGLGSIRYPTGELDLWFDTVRNQRIFLITDIWEAVRDSLFSIHVTGSASKPRGDIIPLGSISRQRRAAAARFPDSSLVQAPHSDSRYLLEPTAPR